MKIKTKLTALAAALAISITGCGGGGDTTVGIGGSGFVSSGAITGFGSVYVNGVKYETNASSFDIEGDTEGKTQSDLAIGMVVNVNGTINLDGTRTVSSIVFDDQLQGPVAGLAKPTIDTATFTVLGINVIAERASTNFDNVTFDTLADSDNIEISGFYDSTNTLHASRIEKKSDSEVEFKGTISGLPNTTFTITNGATSVNVEGSSIALTGFSNGEYVEVKGNYNSGTITATEMESEEFELGDSDEFEVEGYITDYVDDNNFKINGISINTSEMSSIPITLANDIKIEVEGYLDGGTLYATEISQESGEIDITAPITSINTTTQSFEVTPVAGEPAITIQVSNETEFEDEFTSIDSPTFSDLTTDLFVELHGYGQDNGDTFWSKVTITGNTTTNEGVVVESQVEAIDDVNKTVILLGVTFATDGSTVYEQNEVSIGGWSEFYSAITVDKTVIEVEDTNSDGIADKIEID